MSKRKIIARRRKRRITASLAGVAGACLLMVFLFTQMGRDKEAQKGIMQESADQYTALNEIETLPKIQSEKTAEFSQTETAPVVVLTPELTSEPTPELTSEPTPELTPEPTPEPTPESVPEEDKLLEGLVIGVDPGHQLKSHNEHEPVAPGSEETKKGVSSGTQGRFTRVPEHEVTLAVGLKLMKLLEDAGATVVMTRTEADVDITNVERAQLFNEKKVDLGIRIHCNGSEDESAKGAFMLVPSDKDYPFYDENVKAAKCILEAYHEETGIGISRGITYRSDQTGFNWCVRPIVNIEMGHMTNEEEDYKLTNKDFQTKMAQGIFNGVVDYFQNVE